MTTLRYSPGETHHFSQIPRHLKTNDFYRDVWNQVHKQGGDAKIAITAFSPPGKGLTRRGKSSLAIKLGTYFDIDKYYHYRFGIQNCVFSLEELAEFYSEKHPRGTVVMMEEIQNWMNVRTSMTKGNIDAIKKFSVSGNLGYIYVMTCPKFDDIDKQIRQYIHWECRITNRDDVNKLICWYPLKCAVNYNPSLPMYKLPYFHYDRGMRETLRIRTTLPPADLFSAYEDKAFGVKHAWQTKVLSSKVVSTAREQEYLSLINEKNLWDANSISEVSHRLDCSMLKASKVYSLIQDKLKTIQS